MKTTILMMGAATLVLAPSYASAAAGSNTSGASHAGAPVAAGQPGADCVSLVNSDAGSFPGQSSSARGSAFNEDPGGVAGSKYAGEQTQNTINSATSSQYDVACLHGTRSPQ
jgi:hypothetical protein